MADPKPPKIEFPCHDYPIKVLGDAGEELQQLVIEVMERHAPDFDQTCLKVRDSRNGRYQSFTVCITATGEDQLRAINDDLRASPLTKMVI
jgi:uncharacterized protein